MAILMYIWALTEENKGQQGNMISLIEFETNNDNVPKGKKNYNIW